MRYLQLAHNVWDPVAKRSRAQVIYNFGREDAVSRAALERLVGSSGAGARLVVREEAGRRTARPASAGV